MNDDLMTQDTMAMDEIEQRLRTYADARLSPTPEAVERMRAAIVARAVGATAVRGLPPRSGASVRQSWWPILSRRAVGGLLAAALTVGSSAAVFASTPGSPLYGTRLWLESLTLPQSGDARIDAQIVQLDTRDAEVEQASSNQDATAVTAALAAFDDEVTAAVRDAGNDASKLAHLEAVLQKHITVLQGVLAKVPAAAVPAIEAAITASSKALAQIEARLLQVPAPTPRHTPAPHPTPDASKPDKTPAPHSTQAPKPDKTPAAHPTPGGS
jgi:hypothetical protein